MNGLRTLPGFERSPHGLEWALLKRLPAVFGWGTALPLAAVALLWWWTPGLATSGAGTDPGRLLLTYQLLGVVAVHWSLVLTVAIGCCIVMLMKGPAYVADAYPPPGRDTHA